MVTTGNRSRIRFKDPREIRAIVCPTPPPPLHPISPFLSLLNFETSWGVSIYIYIYIHVYTHTLSFCLYYYYKGDIFTRSNDREFVALCSSTFQAEEKKKKKKKERNRRNAPFLQTNQGFSNV